MMDTNSINLDVIIIGAGPAGLSAAIRLGQLANLYDKKLQIGVLEKASEVGAHSLSGAVLNPIALNELISNWRDLDAPLNIPVSSDEFRFLTPHKSIRLPTPRQMRNTGNFIISLGQLTRWLAKQAESLGVEIFTGFAATEFLMENNRVCGVKTNPVGLNRESKPKSTYQPGVNLIAPYTLLAEGARGSLTKKIIKQFELDKKSDPNTYAIGIKELWEIPEPLHQPGKIVHTVGWPLDRKTYGGSFLYHFENNQIAIGLVTGLDYQNPYLDPHYEFQRFKHHPYIEPLLEKGRRLAYGARVLNEGGFQSLPQLEFPGGLLIGCSAGFLNVPQLKGNHTAMKSGMLAAETLFESLSKKPKKPYTTRIQESWIWRDLKLARNIRPAFRLGLFGGLIYAALETYLLGNRTFWTFRQKPDHLSLKPANQSQPIDYPKPDGKISFDKLSSIHLSNIHHEHDQPCHLLLSDPTIPLRVNLPLYNAPEQRYCPAQVYEICFDKKTEQPYLQINAQNCLHCKTCDIKDPTQNITWIPPEGGNGPNYPSM